MLEHKFFKFWGVFFLENFRDQKFILKLTDLYETESEIWADLDNFGSLKFMITF